MRRRGLLAPALAVPLLLGAAAPTVDRTIRDEGLDENSGMVASARFPGVLWVLEDSGNDPVLLAVDPDGRTAARVEVRDVGNRDWEALAPLTLPDGTPALAVGEIGDNDAVHNSVQVHVVAEPRRLEDAAVRPLVTLDLTYPDGPDDAEALLADPRDGRLYVVTKDLLGAGLYAVPQEVWPPAGAVDAGARDGVVTAELEFLTGLSVPIVTDGAVLPDGRLVLRNYGNVSVLGPVESLARDTVVGALATDRLPDQEQGESLAVVEQGRALLVGSEGVRQPVHRVPVPAVPTGGGPSGAGTSSPGSGSPAATLDGTAAAGEGRDAAAGSARTALWTAAGAAVLVLLGGLWVSRARRR